MTDHCKDILYKDIAPSVINNEMLVTAIDEQQPSGEGGRLAREDGIIMNEVTCLRLEFLNILRIDYLWVLTGLTKLSLSNNMIEKIENLDALIHLTELDLSYNEIEVIENLDELTKLEVLTLYSNRISEIQNMQMLRHLHIFSIGKNEIERRETIFQLRRLNGLRSVNMAENKCSDAPDFRIFVATFLPQIMYYEYKRITAEERNTGQEIFKRELKEVIEGEAKEIAQLQKEEDERLEAELHADSFVEFLGERQLFDSLFEKDPDGQILLLINEVDDLYTEYEAIFLEVTRKLFEIGQERYQTRKIEMTQYYTCVETAKEENQLKSQKVMDEYLEQKSSIVSQLKTEREAFHGDDNDIDYVTDSEFMQKYIDIFSNLIHDTWKKLMNLEMNLFDQLEETNLNFERALTDLVTAFIEEAQGYFTQLRSFEASYMESVFEATNKLAANYDPNAFILDELRPICEDKEIQNNAVAASHDIHMQLIDGREDRLVSRAKAWLQNLVTNLQKGEISRNRGKVLEINHFLDCQREELEELYMETPGLNPDITAALTS